MVSQGTPIPIRLDQSNDDGWTPSRAGLEMSETSEAPILTEEAGICEVRAGCIGRGHAGKTALFRALVEGPIGEYFPSGLHVDVGNPREAAKMIRDAEETRRILELSGLPPTLEASQIRYYLYDGDEQRVVFQMQEVIGQILTHTLPESDQTQQARYEAYLRSLLDTQAIWTVVPLLPPNPTARDKRRYANDLRLTSAYLREALRQRPPDRSCAVALVVSKIDTLFENAEAAQAGLTDELLMEALGPLVNTIRRSSRVEDAAIFPVSAFGFGNAMLRQLGSEAQRGGEEWSDPTFADEPVWLLKDNAVMEPFNLSPLLLWTLLFGLLNQNPASEAMDGADLAEVCRMLREDLGAAHHWLVPIKGQLANHR